MTASATWEVPTAVGSSGVGIIGGRPPRAAGQAQPHKKGAPPDRQGLLGGGLE